MFAVVWRVSLQDGVGNMLFDLLLPLLGKYDLCIDCHSATENDR